MNLSRFFHDKVVVITGSARGIGRETARQALAAGARVVLNGRNPAVLEVARASLGDLERTMAVTADVSRPEEAEYLVAATLAAWGRVDVLINNAGLSMRGDFAELSNDTVRTMVEANFLTAVWTTRATLPSLRMTRGRVVFVSSLAGLRGFPAISAYSASKMALSALHGSLRAEEGRRGVRFGLVFLPFIENDAEKTILGADGKPFHHERSWSMTQSRAARAVLSAAASGRGRSVLTFQGHLLAWAQAWLPGLVDLFVRRSAGKIHEVGRT